MSLETKIQDLIAAIDQLTRAVAAASAAPADMPLPSNAPASPPPNPPFTDAKGMMDYIMSSYKTLGPQHGNRIHAILASLGYQNVNDVSPAHYGDLFNGIEQLKREL